MDFKNLLSLAKDNQSYNLKKFERDKLLRSKGDKNQVSDSAVKAFLAKKEKEAKMKRDADLKARQERILARVDGGSKKGAESKSSASREVRSNSKTTLQKKGSEVRKSGQLSDGSRKQINTKQIEKQTLKKQNEKTSKSSNCSAEESKRNDHRNPRNNTEASRETNKDIMRPKKDISYEPLKQEKKTEKKKPRANSAKKTGLSFSELMQMAKDQANKPVTVQKPKKETIQEKKEKTKTVDPEYDYDKSKKKGRSKDSRDRNSKNGFDTGKRSNPNLSSSLKRVSNVAEGQGKQEPLKRKQEKCTLVTETVKTIGNYDRRGNQQSSFKRPLPPENFRNGKSRVIPGQKRLRDIDMDLEREKRELEKKRMMFRSKYGGEQIPEDDYDYYDYNDNDDYDEEEDDMDDFIDDSEASLDVSSEIRKIFGYDRRKFVDDDDDDNLLNMEASYSQIAQEEARSARIAKLEDDIERLKELKEMRKSKKRGR